MERGERVTLARATVGLVCHIVSEEGVIVANIPPPREILAEMISVSSVELAAFSFVPASSFTEMPGGPFCRDSLCSELVDCGASSVPSSLVVTFALAIACLDRA